MSNDIELDNNIEGSVKPEDFVAKRTGGTIETPENVSENVNRDQKEFEEFTKNAFLERAKILKGGDGYKILTDFAKAKGFGKEIMNQQPLMMPPLLVSILLFDGKPPANQDGWTPIEFPFDHLKILEVGGYNYEEEYWLSSHGWGRSKVDYTGISKDVPAGDDLVGGTRRRQVGQQWCLKKISESENEEDKEYYIEEYQRDKMEYTWDHQSMDAIDLPKEYPDGNFEFVYGLGFLGTPMYYGAKAEKVSEREYTKKILNSIKQVMRPGGFAFYLNREPTAFTGDDWRELDMAGVEFEYMGQQAFILRKHKQEQAVVEPEAEKSLSENPNENSVENPEENIEE